MATPFPEDVPQAAGEALRWHIPAMRPRFLVALGPFAGNALGSTAVGTWFEFEAECTESGPAAWLDAVLRCHFERLEAVKAERDEALARIATLEAERRCPLDPGPGGE